MQVQTDQQLHELAHKRVEFRTHLLVYSIVIGALWVIWLVTSKGQAYPWPVWPTGGWGIGLLFQYVFDYRKSKFLSEEKEYEKLKKQMGKDQPFAD